MTCAEATFDVVVRVNGIEHSANVPVRQSLADFLRDTLGLTGTHLGCEEGQCGACTVLLDGAPVRACLMLAAQADGTAVITIEGLHASGEIADLQQAFYERAALQCGFCTSGMVIAGLAMIKAGTALDRDAVRTGLSGHICRCTGYHAIVDAILEAAADRKECGDV